MEDGAIAFIEGRIVVEFHELRDLNKKFKNGAVRFFAALVMYRISQSVW